jgi:hypothetical protein
MLLSRDQYAVVAKCSDQATRAACSEADVEMAMRLLGIKDVTGDRFSAIERAVEEQNRSLMEIVDEILRLQSEGKKLDAYIYAVDNMNKIRSVFMFENVFGMLLHEHRSARSQA